MRILAPENASTPRKPPSIRPFLMVIPFVDDDGTTRMAGKLDEPVTVWPPRSSVTWSDWMTTTKSVEEAMLLVRM
jgi:hypothetical protein